MKLPPDDQRLAALLRPPPLPDDGFSSRVLATLPAPAAPRSYRWLFVGIGAFAGAALALRQIGSLGGMTGEVERALTPLAAEFANPSVGLGLVVAAASVVYALRLSGPRSHAQ